MTCNTEYCDLHDYPVASPWCEYKWQMEQRGRRAAREEEAHARLMDLIDMREYLDEAQAPRKETGKRRPSAPTLKSGGYNWNQSSKKKDQHSL